ncbi:MAG: fatty acid desaturase [Alphaproteobacteria bacterium]
MQGNGADHVGQWIHDARIRGINCDDLLALNAREKCIELTISLPWLAAEIFLIAQGWYVPAAAAAFFFFLTGLRQVHQGYHLALGLSRRMTDIFLFVLSVLMLGSMHAVKYNHLMHHRHCLGDDDIEAKSAKMSGLGAILFGPVFPLMLHFHALKEGNAYYRGWIVAELLGNVCIVIAALYSPALLCHVLLMAAGQCLTAFFAVWTVHHDCAGDVFARTQRGFLKNFISYDMFYHVEHHLFPKVPQRFLPLVAKRLDAVAPELTGKMVY